MDAFTGCLITRSLVTGQTVLIDQNWLTARPTAATSFVKHSTARGASRMLDRENSIT